MKIKKIKLKNFRNYETKEFVFDSDSNIFFGKNGIGKTNILEAIYLLSQGKSWRTRYDFELINYNEEVANIIAKVNSTDLFIGFERGQNNRTKKIFKVNGVNRTVSNFTQNTVSVIFSPQDLDILLGSPKMRRDFLDSTLNQVDPDYRKNTLRLKKIVSNRNKLLERVNEGLSLYSDLFFWNSELVNTSEFIHNKRKELVIFINDFINSHYTEVSNSNSKAKVIYDHSIANVERIQKYKTAEIASKRTLVGAQKDDLQIEVLKNFNKNKQYKEARYFASRGEQRTLVFLLKVACLEFIKKHVDGGIILLLDDIYSELDQFHRAKISEYFENNQVFITTAEKTLIPPSLLKTSNVVEL